MPLQKKICAGTFTHIFLGLEGPTHKTGPPIDVSPLLTPPVRGTEKVNGRTWLAC